MKTTKTDEGRCATCNHTIDAHTGFDHDEAPLPHDLTVCIYCGTISEFDDDMNLIPVSPEELAKVKEEDEQAWAVITHASYLVKQRLSEN